MLTIADLEMLARTRLREATALFIAKEYSGSAYLSGYAVELTLKGKICMVLNWEGFPETRSEFNGLQSFKIHDLEILAFLAGLTHVLGTKYVQAWSDVTDGRLTTAIAVQDPLTRLTPRKCWLPHRFW